MIPVLSFFASIIIVFFLLPEYFRNKSKTVLFFTVCATLKYILMPLFYCIAPIITFSDFTPSDLNDINFGICLMLYELLVLAFCVINFTRKDYNKFNKNRMLFLQKRQYNFLLETNNFFIVLFIALALFIIAIDPTTITAFSFLFLKADTGIRVSATRLDTSGALLRTIVLYGIYSAFIVFSVWCAKKYNKNKKRLFLLLALMFALSITMILVREAREIPVYCGYASIVLLTTLFPQKRKTIRFILASVTFIVVLFLTLYKSFYVFHYSSYSEAFFATGLQLEGITRTLEAYLLGPLQYTACIEMANTNYTFPFTRLLYEIFRSTMGTNFLVRQMDMSTTSMIFNEFLTGGRNNHGLLLPITGLGYLYLTPLFAPLLTCIVYRFASIIEYEIDSSRYAFGVFFMSYIYIRLSTCIVCSNLNTVLTISSIVFWIAGTLYFTNKYIRIG